MSGNPQRQKGDRFEREIVASFEGDGMPAQRVPLSGAAGGMFSGDIHVLLRSGRQKVECKVRARAFKELYDWLIDNYAVVLKRDRAEPLVVMRLSDFKRLAKEEW